MCDRCEDWAEHLYEPEDALTPDELDGLNSHLQLCPDCTLERELFLESWLALDEGEEDLEPSPLLRAQVWERIRQEGPATSAVRDSLEVAAPSRWRHPAWRLAAAAAALFLGFGLGRSLRPEAPLPSALPGDAVAQQPTLDPELIELASQDGFSVELFPESTQFTPLDTEMMSALAPSHEAREWLVRKRGAVVPLQYISQGLPQRGQKAP